MRHCQGRALSARGWAGASVVCGGESDEFLMSSNASKSRQKQAKAGKSQQKPAKASKSQQMTP
jgi:hypothetical protein